MNEVPLLSATALADAIRRGDISARDAVAASLARIDAVQPALNPFAFVFADEATAAAEAADAARDRSEALGPLHGLPVAFKDFTPTKGHRTTRGSAAFEHWIAEDDPAIVRRFKAAGAIIIGKTTTPEFAYSSFTRSPLWGHTRNPWDASRTSGGSSGGAAVAAATGCVALAEGTDMGGSVRIPAGCCGCVGLKPSLGRIPMDILPTALDDMSHFGPLARTVEDAALFLRIAEGPDARDMLSQRSPTPLPERPEGEMRGRKIALCPDLGCYALDPAVDANLRATADALAGAGAEIIETTLDWRPDTVDAWLDWWGVYLSAGFGHLLDDWRDRMDPNVVDLMEAGNKMGAVAFKRIETARTTMWMSLAPILERCDALLTATNAIPAPLAEAPDAEFSRIDEEGRLHGFDMTTAFNMLSPCPALSVPSGVAPGGLPTGAQIVGRRWDDPTVLEIGAAIERERPWRQWTLSDLSPTTDRQSA